MEHIFLRNVTFLRIRYCGITRRFLTRSASLRLPHVQKKLNDEDDSDSETHFGFETISGKEKTSRVHGVFEQVASSYDKMNDLMSMGIHRWWKDIFVSTLNPFPDTKIVDVAGGTGDIAFRLVKAIDTAADRSSKRIGNLKSPFIEETRSAKNHPDVTVCDLSESMLEVGKQRALKNGLDSRIQWIHGNAENLPFEDDFFDAYTIAFGIRNITHIDKALDEAFRVLKDGGRFLCLEFSEVKNPLLSWLYDKYSMQVIPVMGQLVASDWKSYQYLVESIRMFPNQEEFKQQIENAGFKGVTYRNLSQGICAIHSGFKFEN